MPAATFTGYGEPFDVEEVEEPQLDRGVVTTETVTCVGISVALATTTEFETFDVPVITEF